MTTEQRLPAATFAHEVLALLAQGDLTLTAFAHSIDVTSIPGRVLLPPTTGPG